MKEQGIDFRRGLILGILALRSTETYWKIVGQESLGYLQGEDRTTVELQLGAVLSEFGFSDAADGSQPNYLAYCLEEAIDYVNRNA